MRPENKDTTAEYAMRNELSLANSEITKKIKFWNNSFKQLKSAITKAKKKPPPKKNNGI